MRLSKEEPSSTSLQAIDLITAVRELHGLSSQELGKLIRDSENNILQRLTENGSCIQVDAEKLARYLPLHLIAVIMSSKLDEASVRYLLCGLRLLNSLCDLASRHTKLEQILLDDVKVSEQLLDLIIYLLIVLAGDRQGYYMSSDIALLHSALVACSLHLLTGSISSQWQELAQVLLAHPKVDIFMDVAFAAVRVDIKFLQIKLSVKHPHCDVKLSSSSTETLKQLCQHCEASLQFLQSLCQQKLFRERLVKNKELCGKGGVLLLAKAIMKLDVTPLSRELSVVAAVSRLKSKVLSILRHLCEAESVSYLDEVASTPGSLDLAKFVAFEVLELLKTMFAGDHSAVYLDKTYPKGLLQLNAMRLADVFSDDSNFRSYITIYFTEVLATIFSLPHGEFLSTWCSSDIPVWEEDATLEYDSFAAVGVVLNFCASSDSSIVYNSESTFIRCNMLRTSYAHQRTSLLVKIMANLHCFVPDICKEDKDLFLNKFLQCLRKELSIWSDGFSSTWKTEKSASVARNLRSLLSHAQSLIPSFLNEEDVQLLRVFFSQVEAQISPAEFEVDRVQESKYEDSISWEKLSKLNPSENHQISQEAQSTKGCLQLLVKEDAHELNNRNSNLKEGFSENSTFLEADQFSIRSNGADQGDDAGRQENQIDTGKPCENAAQSFGEYERDQNAETSGSDSSSTRGKTSNDHMDSIDFPKSSEHTKESGLGVQENEKVEAVRCEEKQQRKRKRTIMNDKQIMLIEEALLDEPDMQRNAASVQSWADKLSAHGSEVTTSRLKNWLNNRKARLARAAKDGRAPSEGDIPDKQGGTGSNPHVDNSERVVEDVYPQSNAERNCRSGTGGPTLGTGGNEKSASELAELIDVAPPEFVQCEPGQYVVLVNEKGEEIGKGKVHQVLGKWYGKNLEESETCVVDIIELKAERWAKLPHACEAMGTSFDQAEKILGVMRVLWDSNKLFMLQPR